MPGGYIPPPPPPQEPEEPPVEHVRAGLWWPAADPGKLRAASAAWYEVAGAIDQVIVAGDGACSRVKGANSGEAIQAFATFWGRYSAGTVCTSAATGAYLTDAAVGARQLGLALSQYADAVDEARRKVMELIAEIAAATIIGIGLAVLTVGVSSVAAGAVAGGLISAAAAVGVALSQTVATIVATIAVGATVGALEAMAIDAVVIQPMRIVVFDSQDQFDWGEVGEWGMFGGAFGAAGGAFRGVRAANDVRAWQALPRGVKGEEGARLTIDKWSRMGFRVDGREITVRTPPARTRLDIVVSRGGVNPERVFLEAKNGPAAGLTANQRAAFPYIESTGGTWAGQNAARAGFTPGATFGPTRVVVEHWNATLAAQLANQLRNSQVVQVVWNVAGVDVAALREWLASNGFPDVEVVTPSPVGAP
jgi:hypothetical protein